MAFQQLRRPAAFALTPTPSGHFAGFLERLNPLHEHGAGVHVDRIVFSSEELPSELDGPTRARLWRDLYCARFGEADLAFLPGQPFFGRLELAALDGIMLTRFNGTLSRVARTSAQIAADTRDDFLIGFNCGGPQQITQHGREVASTSGRTIFYTNTEPSCAVASEGTAVIGLSVSRARLTELLPEANDRICTTFDATHEAVQHLERYIGFLLVGYVSGQGATAKHIGTTIVDLLALALGASQDAQELARLRGLRAARLEAIVSAIRQGFSDPGFSVHDVARSVGLKPRYVQNLLSETGASFSERVIECRLQKARTMLQGRDGSRKRISDIAYACGFNEVSYFNRCFRRRFGASPTEFREAAD